MDHQGFTTVDTLDAAQIRELHALYQGEWWTRGRSLVDVKQMLEASALVFAVITQPDRRLAAFARVLTDGVFKALVFDVIVAPAFRHLGLGQRLMESIVQHPTLSRVKHIELYCLPELVPFYEQWGFSTNVAGVSLMRRSDG